jgi:hypothetical protein
MPGIDLLYRGLLTAASCLYSLYLGWHGKDAWPFTRFPMFSRRLNPLDLKVIRFRLVTLDGGLKWWNPRFYRYPDRIGDKTMAAGAPGVLWGAAEVLRLVALEEGGANRYKAVEVVERSWNGHRAVDRILARIPAAAPPGSERR